MKVLWFEVTIPSRYKDDGVVIAGWQDSLETIVRTCPEIQLTIAFEGNREASERKKIDGVEYIPMVLPYSITDRIRNYWTWEAKANLLEREMQKVVQEIQPDIIQVYGTEWPFGRIAKFTTIPVVVHIMGAIVPYNNALYPPMYSIVDKLRSNWWNPKHIISSLLIENKQKSWEKSERQVWSNVRYFMGRTEWDENLSIVLHPGRLYFHVEEALRPQFLFPTKEWKVQINKKIRLISTGCSTMWKGPDMMLKTARILKSLDIDFEWNVAGMMDDKCKKMVERKEHTTFEENNVNLIGYVQPDELSDILCTSTLYVHTAYVENSPNSICEAQCLGVPVVCTNVGGIASLVKDREHGVLVPANDPWQMAAAIIRLAQDMDLLSKISKATKAYARERHNPENIKKQLLNCYSSILNDVK